MNKRIEIEKVENGFTVTIWNQSEDDMYSEPTKFVAESKESVIELIKEHCDD